MEFDIQGNLKPYDIIYTDWATFKAEFVDAFPRSSTRQVIFENFSVYMEKLVAIIGTDFHQWIDGSFVTKKLDPGDIDVVTFVDASIYERNEFEIDILRDDYRDHDTRVDEYFVKRYPETHGKYDFYHMDMLQWYNQFTTSRALKSKGFIQLNF
ncbi:hypothetical protein SAMN05216327_11170 [Dyadobacter sp. SG02]|uniref:DUF6932 family protein n=1 Tax=Dyadobacter sp. SG02 TaxID=1855291 RepID=UPI0008CBF312|nr:hypothetical protein [Dyadobacter sp. SG02]SEJ48142.1 hypothetical protein SAMN05216327_11170 [Dyadobacter sp. SG02]